MFLHDISIYNSDLKKKVRKQFQIIQRYSHTEWPGGQIHIGNKIYDIQIRLQTFDWWRRYLKRQATDEEKN